VATQLYYNYQLPAAADSGEVRSRHERGAFSKYAEVSSFHCATQLD
jgi:hypothetical protein